MTTTPFHPLSLHELFALDLPEPEFAVDDLLPLGAATLLTAREKSGKGLLSIDLCASVAADEPFLGRAVRQGPAIYCAAEEHTREVRQRIAHRIDEERHAPLYVLPLNGSTDDRLRLDDPALMDRLVAMIAELHPVVVVLDTLRELHDRQEDSSDEMGPLLRPVRQLAHQFNVAIVVNHHQNKLGGFRGSTAIRAAVDLEWAFTRTDRDGEETPRGTLRVEGRFGPRQHLAVELGEGLRWTASAAAPTLIVPGLRDRILTALAGAEDGRNADEIATALAVTKKTVQNEIARLRKEVPPVIVVAAGRGTKTDPQRYRLATDQPMLPSSPVTYGESSGGNHSRTASALSPNSSGSNGNHAGNDQQHSMATAGDDHWTR